MGGRVQLMQHAFSVFWTLLFLICSTWDSGSASGDLDSIRHGYNQDSIRLLKLKLLALELGSDDVRPKKVYDTPHFFTDNKVETDTSWSLKNILTPGGRGTSEPQHPTEKRDDIILNINNVIAPDRRQVRMSLLNRLYRDVTAMDNVRGAYADFYDYLTNFVNLLASRLLPQAPAALQYVKTIPSVLPKDDPDFTSGNVDKVVVKCTFVLDITNEVVTKVPPFVLNEYQSWLSSAGGILRYWGQIVTMSLMNLRLQDDGNIQGISILPDGISGINTGVNNGMDFQTLKNLSELVKVLESVPYTGQTSS